MVFLLLVTKFPPALSTQGQHLDNIIYLPGKPGGRAAPVPSLSEVVPMSTYEELSLIVRVALLIVTILNYTHKK